METGNSMFLPLWLMCEGLQHCVEICPVQMPKSLVVLQLWILKGSSGCRPFCSRPPLKMSDGPLAILRAYLLVIGPHWHSSERLPMHLTSSLGCSEVGRPQCRCLCAGSLLPTVSEDDPEKCWSEACACVSQRQWDQMFLMLWGHKSDHSHFLGTRLLFWRQISSPLWLKS